MTAAAAVAGALFGDNIRKTSIPELERRTGIPKSTLYAYRRDPDRIPLRQAIIIANAIKLSPVEWQKIREA